MRVNRGDVIAGMDALKIRSFLRKHSDFEVNYLTVMKTFSTRRRKAEKLIQDLVELQLLRRCEFQPEKSIICYETTMAGNAFGMAKAGKPILRASAERILREFLDRVGRANLRSEFAFNVESVVLFGSYLSDCAHVNDLDLAIELKSKASDERTSEQLWKERLAAARGRRFANLTEEIGWPETEILMFLKNRSRTISLCHWQSLFDMPDLRYCVLVGDEQRIA